MATIFLRITPSGILIISILQKKQHGVKKTWVLLHMDTGERIKKNSTVLN